MTAQTQFLVYFAVMERSFQAKEAYEDDRGYFEKNGPHATPYNAQSGTSCVLGRDPGQKQKDSPSTINSVGLDTL